MKKTVCALALAMGMTTIGTWIPAAADTLDAPVITSPANLSTVSPEVTATATSGAPYVLFRLATHGTTDYIQNEPVPTVGGEATDTVPAYGLLSGGDLSAVACSSSSVADCGTTADTVILAFQGGSTAPAFGPTSNADRLVMPGKGTYPLEVAAQYGAGKGTLWLEVYPYLSGPSTPYVTRLPITEGTQQVSFATVADGDYKVRVARCSTLNPAVCARTGAYRTVWVKRKLEITVGNMAIAQNGDGFQDVAAVQLGMHYALSGEASWRLLEADGLTPVLPWRSVGTVNQTTIFHVDPAAELGHELPTGDYLLQVEVHIVRDGYDVLVSETGTLHSWKVGPLTTLKSSSPVFYPVADTYRDTLKLDRPLDPDAVSFWEYQILDATDHVVVTRNVEYADGPRWNGRDNDGHLLPEGKYRLSISLLHGGPEFEERVFTTPQFYLSHKRLRHHTWTRTVNAADLFLRDASGRCSDAHPAGRTVVYDSGARCHSDATRGMTARGRHGLMVPHAFTYDAVDFAVSGHGQPARFGVYRADGTPSVRTRRIQDWVDPFPVGGYPAQRLIDGHRRLRWYVQTTDSRRYVARQFVVKLYYTRLER